jgi:hypothetical protein
MAVVSTIPAAVGAMAGRLRFPQLFLLTAALFVVDLLIPDLIPFADEMLLGLLAVLFGMWRQRPGVAGPAMKGEPAMKDVTPRPPQPLA